MPEIDSAGLGDVPSTPERIVFELKGDAPGPVVLICVAMHGNEVDGLEAARVVTRALQRQSFSGRLCVFLGNRAAYQAQQRYITRDLNRAFTEEGVRAARSAEQPRDGEDVELRAILDILAARIPRDGSRAIFLDLHCTSAAGPPFAVFGDTRANRRLGFAFQIPAILGLEEAIDGTLLEFLARRGHVAVCVEGGQLKTEATQRVLECAIWITLLQAGCIRASDVPHLHAMHERLSQAAGALPRVLEIRHREALRGTRDFAMHPGWKGFDRVVRGEHLADNTSGPIYAPEAGYLLMPLYQSQGDDGFFVARSVHPFWLRLSTLLRKLRLDRCIAWLPGVRHDPTEPETLLVNRRIARWWTIEIFHLFGYRRRREHGECLRFSRRRPGYLPALPVDL